MFSRNNNYCDIGRNTGSFRYSNNCKSFILLEKLVSEFNALILSDPKSMKIDQKGCSLLGFAEMFNIDLKQIKLHVGRRHRILSESDDDYYDYLSVSVTGDSILKENHAFYIAVVKIFLAQIFHVKGSDYRYRDKDGNVKNCNELHFKTTLIVNDGAEHTMGYPIGLMNAQLVFYPKNGCVVEYVQLPEALELRLARGTRGARGMISEDEIIEEESKDAACNSVDSSAHEDKALQVIGMEGEKTDRYIRGNQSFQVIGMKGEKTDRYIMGNESSQVESLILLESNLDYLKDVKVSDSQQGSFVGECATPYTRMRSFATNVDRH